MVRRCAIVLALVMALPAMFAGAGRAQPQKYIEGVFLGTEHGVIELIAWAEGNGVVSTLKMTQGFIEDAPVIPRTYRIMCNLPGWTVSGIFLANSDVFVRDRLESKWLPFTNARLSMSTFEVGVPELERWENVARLKKTLKATPEKPLYVFLSMANPPQQRFYPFRVEQ